MRNFTSIAITSHELTSPELLSRTVSQLHKHHLSGKMEACLFLILWSFPCAQPREPLAQTQWPHQNGLFKSLPKLLKKVIAYMNISILDRGQGIFSCKRKKLDKVFRQEKLSRPRKLAAANENCQVVDWKGKTCQDFPYFRRETFTGWHVNWHV